MVSEIKLIYKVKKEFSGCKLSYWFKKNYPNSSYILFCKLVRKGVIKKNGARSEIFDVLLENDEIKIPKSLQEDRTEKKLRPCPDSLVNSFKSWIIFEDQNLIILNKPSGIAVQGGSKINYSIDLIIKNMEQFSAHGSKLVHRIDKDTSGILMISKNLEFAKYICKLFKERLVNKYYIVLCIGNSKLDNSFICSDIYQEGRSYSAHTNFITLDTNKKFSLLLVNPKSGRKHQIRKHLFSIKLPILGDKKFFHRSNLYLNKQYNLCLHSYYISFLKKDKKQFCFTADLPESFEQNCKKLGLLFDKNKINKIISFNESKI